MSEQDAGAAATQQPGISIADAAARYAAQTRGAPAAGKANTDISAHASALGKRSAEARKERTTNANAQPEPDDESGGENGLNDPGNGTQDEIVTADTESPNGADTGAEGESQDEESGTIDLGDGVTVTLDEVRESFMLKADHTRKTQALSEERKQLEAVRTQRLSQLESTIAQLQQTVGKPKSMSEWMEADPVNGLKKFAQQQDQLKQIQMARAIAAREERQALNDAHDRRDAALAESYNKEWADPAKREAAYVGLSKYATGLGATQEHLLNMTEPWMIQVLDKAQKFDKLQADKGNITKTLAAKPKVVKVGAKVSAQAQVQNTVRAARANLEKSHSVADAVALWRASKKARGAA